MGNANQSLQFDPAETLPVVSLDIGDGGGVIRLPNGGRMPLILPSGKEIRLRMAHQWFRLKRVAGEVIIDEQGEVHMLRPGRNVVGRGVDADIQVGADCLDISRHHMVVEVRDEEIVVLTDTSTGGTCIGTEAFY